MSDPFHLHILPSCSLFLVNRVKPMLRPNGSVSNWPHTGEWVGEGGGSYRWQFWTATREELNKAGGLGKPTVMSYLSSGDPDGGWHGKAS